MEHKTLEQLAAVSAVTPVQAQPLTRRQRLERWATALEEGDYHTHYADDPTTYLKNWDKVHFGHVSMIGVHGAGWRHQWIGWRTAFGYAALDPALQADGLTGRYVGDVVAYFGLSKKWVHRNLCYCVASGSVPALVRAIRAEATRVNLWQYLLGELGFRDRVDAATA